MTDKRLLMLNSILFPSHFFVFLLSSFGCEFGGRYFLFKLSVVFFYGEKYHQKSASRGEGKTNEE